MKFVCALEGLRGYAALLMVVYHAWVLTGGPLLGGGRVIISGGFLAVDLFFVLSAFVLSLPAASSGSFGSWKDYALRRAARIVPAHYAALAVRAWNAPPGAPRRYRHRSPAGRRGPARWAVPVRCTASYPHEATLTARELNRALLARQGLLERRSLSIPDALDAMGGLQAQYAPSMYVGLWSRLADFERASLTRALEDRSVIQATLMRATIHLVARTDYWPLTVATRAARRGGWQRAIKGPRELEMEAAAETLRAALADGPMKRKAIDELLGKPVAHGIGLWVDMVRVPPAGTWERRRADLYGLAEDWVGPPDAIAGEAALDHLVTRYLTGFGPASKAEIANWCGLVARDVEPALGRLTLRRFAAEDGAELLDLPELPLPAADTPAPVRFLGTWDAALLAHARRALILPEEHRARIFNTKMPQSVGTFLVDGAVAGAWRPDGTIEPFAELTKAQRKAVDAEAVRLAEFSA